MYHLVKSLYLHATSLPEYSILLLGLDAAGKTTLLNQIRHLYGGSSGGTVPGGEGLGGRLGTGSRGDGQPSESAGRTVPTVGQNVSVVQLPTLYLRIWDIGGQQTLRGLWHSYYSSCHAIVFVVDSSDVGDADLSALAAAASGSGRGATASAAYGDGSGGRLGECADVLSSVLRDASTAGVPLLVLANKQDREDSVEVVRIKEGFVRRVIEGEDGETRRAGAYVRDSRVLPCSALSGQGVREAVDWVATRVGWNKESRPPVMR